MSVIVLKNIGTVYFKKIQQETVIIVLPNNENCYPFQQVAIVCLSFWCIHVLWCVATILERRMLENCSSLCMRAAKKHDQHAIVVYHDDELGVVVGHIPQEIAKTCH